MPFQSGDRKISCNGERTRDPGNSDDRIFNRGIYSARLNMIVFNRDGRHTSFVSDYSRYHYGDPGKHSVNTSQVGLDSLIAHTFGRDKINTFLHGSDVSAQTVYRSSWKLWGEFRDARQVSYWPKPGVEGWDEILMDYLMWNANILHMAPSALKIRRNAIRFAHVVHGFGDRKTANEADREEPPCSDRNTARR